jgi:hypothetical protein
MLINLSHAHALALCDMLAEYIRTPGHTEIFVDVVRDVETRPEVLLGYLLGVCNGGYTWPEEADRQLLLLALALAALDRPGFASALRLIAAQIPGGKPGETDGTGLYDEFKRLNADRFAAMRPRPVA